MKESELCMKRDFNLETMAKNIFGHDIVKSAYVATWKFDSSTEGQKNERIARDSFTSVDGEIDNGGKNIVICFVNGNDIHFTNSEWGSISNIDLTKVELRP